MDPISFNELFTALQHGDETGHIEAKKAAYALGQSFLETVSAFANEPDLGGGYILFGISRNESSRDPRYLITGVADPDKLQNEIASQCRQCFSIPIRPLLNIIPHPDGNILMAHIPESKPHEKPVFIKSKGLEKGSYRRIGSSDQVCTREDIDLLYQLRSERKYDAMQLEQAAFEDFDPQAIRLYRFEREKIKADAPELRYNDEDLLKALNAITTEKGATNPTMAGILLFGTQKVLRRLCPLRNRTDYILIEGREWVSDPERNYTAVEMCESLITGVPRLLNQIMNDIPQTFALEADELRRKDNPLIPRKVIREALVNALMHRDYRVISPVQIIKYANRIEFRNSGYSLKPQEEIGLPGSMPRNEIIAQVFHDINYAEAKGTGIRTMRDEMKKANLSVPLIESVRSSNRFVLTVLPHHLFNRQDIDWLKQFQEYNLTHEEARTLIILREMGALTNSDYRTIHAVDTLTASSRLRRLRDLGLIEQKGSGNATYYIPGIWLTPQTAPHISPLYGELAPHISPAAPHTSLLCEESVKISQEVQEKLKATGKRAPPEEVKKIILELCATRPFKLGELVILLKRDPKHIREKYLAELVESNILELTFPESPTHPYQAYKLKKL